MCLVMPGRVVSAPPGAELAKVEMAGVVRGLIDGPPHPGDYLVHRGFARQRMTEAPDATAVRRLEQSGPEPEGEP